MTTAIRAKYKNGVLKPLTKIDLPDGSDVTVRIELSDINDKAWLDAVAQDTADRIATHEADLDNESREWLEADLSGELPLYDWGKEGIPKGKPVRYDPDTGVVVVDK